MTSEWKYRIERRSDLNWYIEPPLMDPHVYQGPYQRHQDALDSVNTHIIINQFRPGSISEEGFHVDTAG